MKIFTEIKLRCLSSLFCLLLLSTCSGSGSESSKIGNLVINPEILPSSCKLIWISKPQLFQPTEKYPDDFLGFVIGQFWFNHSTDVDLSKLEVGFSNVLSNPASENALVNIVLIFQSAELAKSAEKYLATIRASQPNFFQIRIDKTLAYFVHHQSVTTPCKSAFQSKLTQAVTGDA